MSCVMSFTGDGANVDRLIELCPVEAYVAFRRGGPRSTRPNARPCATSGISFGVSDAGFDDLDVQQRDAIAFLAAHAHVLAQLREAPGVTRGCLDFGIAMRNVVAQTDGFEPALIQLVAPLGLALVLSQYPVGKKMKRVKQFRRALRRHAR